MRSFKRVLGEVLGTCCEVLPWLGSGQSGPSCQLCVVLTDLLRIVAEGSIDMTLLLQAISQGPNKYVPGPGNRTVPPPLLLQAAKVAATASLSSRIPSPTAPKCRTLNSLEDAKDKPCHNLNSLNIVKIRYIGIPKWINY